MHRLVVNYHQPADPDAFDAHYAGTHAPLAARIPGLRSFTTGHCASFDGSTPAYYMVAELVFESAADMAAGMGSAEGRGRGGRPAELRRPRGHDAELRGRQPALTVTLPRAPTLSSRMWCGRLETYRVQPKGASTWLVRPVLVPIPLRDRSSPVPDKAEEMLDELTAMFAADPARRPARLSWTGGPGSLTTSPTRHVR
jgi:uncharacterized protein (TIGR02118 family)